MPILAVFDDGVGESDRLEYLGAERTRAPDDTILLERDPIFWFLGPGSLSPPGYRKWMSRAATPGPGPGPRAASRATNGTPAAHERGSGVGIDSPKGSTRRGEVDVSKSDSGVDA